ncbi:hypothetical protein BOTBODRAFT_459753 [Botryobasidium botryosum FD-172 SS1]|uniref:Uncharacterized protein n=1 Tax=Botryobasidium botryosum (strain FD-172 SS1) TaxID=930990 RepID=A0A067MIL4_BOTB1|nr:hypothetical protein BOTBODRAFT_459753 [Botryobasidium botryosum FD-172 SS1]
MFDAAARERWGPRSGDRSYRPPGGESLDDVANRGLLSLRKYIKAGVQLAEEPDLSTLPINFQVGDLLEGIPHHVIVSHNIALCEPHDLFVSWNLPNHEATAGSFENTGCMVSRETAINTRHWLLEKPAQALRKPSRPHTTGRAVS